MYGFASIGRLMKLNQESKFPLRTYFSYTNKPQKQPWRNEGGRSERYIKQ